MTLFRSWWRLLRPCQHDATYRERRDGILYFVCHDCDHAAPAISRDAETIPFPMAHERMRAFPKSQPKSPADVVRMLQAHAMTQWKRKPKPLPVFLAELADTFSDVGKTLNAAEKRNYSGDLDYPDLTELFAGDYFHVARRLRHAAKKLRGGAAAVSLGERRP